MTVAEAAALLAAAGVDSAEHDARALARHAQDSGADFDELVRRRAERVPLQHLVGSAGFRYLDLAVGPGVFVPRPETELLVEAVLDELSGKDRPVVVDLGAGSGAIGLSVAREHPSAEVHLVERDPAAFGWLRRNAEGFDRVTLHQTDATESLPELDGSVDVVASNPPYVAEHEREHVAPEVREHDPAVALWAGADGLDLIERFAARALALLRPGGLFAVEHSDRQGESVPALLREQGWTDVADHRDLTGRPRFATGRKPGVVT
jgi:release factor glutamine methyltransferase